MHRRNWNLHSGVDLLLVTHSMINHIKFSRFAQVSSCKIILWLRYEPQHFWNTGFLLYLVTISPIYKITEWMEQWFLQGSGKKGKSYHSGVVYHVRVDDCTVDGEWPACNHMITIEMQKQKSHNIYPYNWKITSWGTSSVLRQSCLFFPLGSFDSLEHILLWLGIDLLERFTPHDSHLTVVRPPITACDRVS